MTASSPWLIPPCLATFDAYTRSKAARSGPGLRKTATRPVYVQHTPGALDPLQVCLYIMPAGPQAEELGLEYRGTVAPSMRNTGFRSWDSDPDMVHRTQIQIMLPTWPEVFANAWHGSERGAALDSYVRRVGSRPVCTGQALILGTRYGQGLYPVQVRCTWERHYDRSERQDAPRAIRYQIDAPAMGEKSEARAALCLSWTVAGWGLYGAPPPTFEAASFQLADQHRRAFHLGDILAPEHL